MKPPHRVLVVEDELDFADLFDRMLRRGGSQPLRVYSLQEAVAELQASVWDLILLDLKLPDSPSPAHTLRTVAPLAMGAPIVVVSSVDDLDLGQRMVLMGADSVLTKDEVMLGAKKRVLHRHVTQAIARKERPPSPFPCPLDSDQLLAASKALRDKAEAIQLSLASPKHAG